MNGKILKFFFTTIALCLTAILPAHQPYEASVIVSFDKATVSDPNLVDLMRDLKQTALNILFAGYTPTSAVAINFDLRGILALSAFAENSTDLVVNIPQSGLTEVFAGATRDESLKLFKEYIRDGGRKHKLLKAYAKYSPIDPIAGNPNSLMAQMGQADYLIGHLSPLSGCDPCWSAQPIVNQVQAGVNVGRGFSHEFDTTIVTLPLRYSYSPNLNWAFILDAPFTYIRNGGASSVFGSLGVGLRLPITHEWSLTSIVRGGAGGSLDLCTTGSFVSAGLTSAYDYKLGDYVVSMTNYAGYILSTNLWLSGVNFNYHLHNYIFKNGLSVTSCKGLDICGRPVNFSLSFTDSYIARESLYIRHYDEVGVSLITTCLNPYLDYDCLVIGFSYQFGQNSYKGCTMDIDYQF